MASAANHTGEADSDRAPLANSGRLADVLFYATVDDISAIYVTVHLTCRRNEEV